MSRNPLQQAKNIAQHLNGIKGSFKLRPPQMAALDILHRLGNVLRLDKECDVKAELAAVKGEFPDFGDFDHDFPSFCFALATGVGKTRLMAAMIDYLYNVEDLKNFLIIAPNLTIYNKLVRDFTPGSEKYLFHGIQNFILQPPVIVTGDDYQRGAVSEPQAGEVRITIINIGKLYVSEKRKMQEIKEVLGESFFAQLAARPDLVMFMDEAHRYRGSAAMKAINELRPVLGIELTATPIVKDKKFGNIIYYYGLKTAIIDGFVKYVWVMTKKNLPVGSDYQELKLFDGVDYHLGIKQKLAEYAMNSEQRLVKPIVLIIAKDTNHAASLVNLVQQDDFFGGQFRGKVLQIDSSTGDKISDENAERLLRVESPDEPTEIIIHVDMLKEGWDVNNLFTIIPLRAANARILLEQTVGRGTRLPFGVRTGVTELDRLVIAAHDNFQALVDDANLPDSPFRLEKLVVEENRPITKTFENHANIDLVLGLVARPLSPVTEIIPATIPLIERSQTEQEIIRATKAAIVTLQKQPEICPTSQNLHKKEIRSQIERSVMAKMTTELNDPAQVKPQDIARMVEEVVTVYTENTIDIPDIVMIPESYTPSLFTPFALSVHHLTDFTLARLSLYLQELAGNQIEQINQTGFNLDDHDAKPIILRQLQRNTAIDYDAHNEFLADLSDQAIKYLAKINNDENIVPLINHFKVQISSIIAEQFITHLGQYNQSVAYRYEVRKGFRELKPGAYVAEPSRHLVDFRQTFTDKSKIAHTSFNHFAKCLYPSQKFANDSERRMAFILENQSRKWFRPNPGQFLIRYIDNRASREYIPDFVAETDDKIFLLEIKAADQISHEMVQAKQTAALKWCEVATDYSAKHGGKAWQYGIIPHHKIQNNMTLAGMLAH